MSTPRTDRSPRPSAGPRPGPGSRPTRGALLRRRLVALALLVGLVVGLVLLGQVVVRAVQPLLTGDEQAQEGRSAPPTPEAVGPPLDCTAASLELGVTASATEYEPGRAVQLDVTLRQSGGRPCLVDGSDAGRQVLVYAGDELVWSSAHCGTTDRLLLMSTGDEDPSRLVRWDRRRSVEGCAPDQPEVGPGTYTAVVSVAGVDGATSEPVTFTLLAPPPPSPEPTETPTDSAPDGSPPAEGETPPAEGETPPAEGTAPAQGTAPAADAGAGGA
ncbi:hypothetical protein [Cellulosimicrobium protaetiae]|uniref:Uncharacterized protein n=1 Tax=Cellulosimicrobium protaetiae TaxID=2587808 RepID=A0A6M5UKE6_9MICO|nr:hypothetical protein [Cellulosimicrobium protaetiae]QJW37701.1 hypothetical protein FIC82_017460 [Cellulosimicrobium protaetiae]